MGLFGESLGMLGKGIKMAVNKAEDFLPWVEEVTYIDEATNGVIKLAKYPDGRTTVIELEVPKEFRGKGVGKKLQAQAMSDNSNLSGQVSSKKAATSAYNLGRRPIDNPNATLDDVYAAIDDMSSVNMATPDAIKAFNGGDSPSGLFNEILELYKTEPLAARKMAKRGGILDEIDDQIPRPKGDVSNADELRAKANAERFNEDYSGQHSAPMSGDGAPLNDLSQVYPDDIYSSKGLQYYGTGDNAIDSESMGIINLLKGKPDQTVTMYRAVPSNAGDVDINAGDWVSLSESYVKQHGEAALNGDYKIISKEVPANQLFTNGDSINEFGFDPANKAPSGLLDMSASDDSEAGVVTKATGGILDELISSFNSFQAAGETVPDSLMADMASEYAKVKPKTHLEGILAQGEQANLSDDVLSQGYKPDVFHHVGSPDMQTYDINANRVSGGSTPAGLYTHNRMRDSKVYEGMAVDDGRPWERYSVVSSTDKPFVVGETKADDTLKGNFIKQMEVKFGDKYVDLPDHKRDYWDEKIDKFMQYGNTTASPLTPVQQRQVYLDSGYDSLLLNGNEMVFLDTGKVRDLRAGFNKADVGKEGLFKSDPLATAGALALSGNVGQAPQGILALNQGRDALLSPQESEYMKGQAELQGLLGVKNMDDYNYSDMLPVKRDKASGGYSPAMTGILRDAIEALYNIGQSRRTGLLDPEVSSGIL